MMAADVFAQKIAVEDWPRRMLFPDPKDAILLPERELGRAKFDLKWIDKDLNYEQQVPPKILEVTVEIRRRNCLGISRGSSVSDLRTTRNRQDKDSHRSNIATHSKRQCAYSCGRAKSFCRRYYCASSCSSLESR